MTANPLRFVCNWLLWPIRRTPTEIENAELRSRLRTAIAESAKKDRRLEWLAKENRQLKVSIDDAEAQASMAKKEIEIALASLENMRAQYRKDVAIAARREAFGDNNPPPTRGRRP